MDAIYEIQAAVCRTLSHPTRIAIIHLLGAGPMEVGRLATELGIAQPNASQHLAVMRSSGLVESERAGRGVIYRLSDPGVVDACDAMADVMRRRLARMAELAETVGAVSPTSTATTATR